MRPVLAGPICQPGECGVFIAIVVAGFAFVLAFAGGTARAVTNAISAWGRQQGWTDRRTTAVAGPAGACAFVVAIASASTSRPAMLAVIAADVVLVVAARRARAARPPGARTPPTPDHGDRDAGGARSWYR